MCEYLNERDSIQEFYNSQITWLENRIKELEKEVETLHKIYDHKDSFIL